MLFHNATGPISAAYRLRRTDTLQDGVPDTGLIDDMQAATGAPEPLLCANCQQTITSRSALMAIQGSTEHRFTNPHGFRFLIACYGHAPGCRGAGEWTAEFTWFPGCQWRYALCGACQTHLGWEYRGAADFFGLIRDRLVESESGQGLH